MAGFMSGFGSAFANSYDKAIDRREARKDEVFKYTFQAYLNGKEEKKKKKTKDAETLRQAKSLIELEGLPADSIGDVYTWLDSGLDPSYVVKRAKSGSWSSKKDEAKASDAEAAGDISADPTKAQAGVEEQTSSALPMTVGGEDPSAMTPGAPEPGAVPAAQAEAPVPDAVPAVAPAAVEAPAPAAPAPVEATPAPMPAATPEAPEPKMPMPRQMTDAFGRIASITGESPEDVQSAMDGADDTPALAPSGKFTPGEPEMDWVSQPEAIVKRDEAIAKGDKVNATRYSKIVSAYDEAANKQAMRDNPAGTISYQWVNPDGVVETKAAIQKEDGWHRVDNGDIIPGNARPIGEAEQKRREDMLKNSPDAIKLNGKQVLATSLFKNGTRVIQMLDEAPESIGIAADVAGAVSNLSDEAQSAIAILNGDNSENPEQAAQAIQTLDEESKRIDEYLAGGIRDAGEAAQLLNAQLVLMSYRAGEIEGIRGRDVTEKEYNRMYEVITGGSSNAKTVQKNIISYMKSLRSNLNTEAKLFNGSNKDFKNYEAEFGPGSAPQEALVESVDDLMLGADDPELKAAYDLMTKQKMEKVDAPEESSVEAIPMEEATPTLLADPSPENKKYFDEAYGVGAADKALKAAGR